MANERRKNEKKLKRVFSQMQHYHLALNILCVS